VQQEQKNEREKQQKNEQKNEWEKQQKNEQKEQERQNDLQWRYNWKNQYQK